MRFQNTNVKVKIPFLWLKIVNKGIHISFALCNGFWLAWCEFTHIRVFQNEEMVRKIYIKRLEVQGMQRRNQSEPYTDPDKINWYFDPPIQFSFNHEK